MIHDRINRAIRSVFGSYVSQTRIDALKWALDQEGLTICEKVTVKTEVVERS